MTHTPGPWKAVKGKFDWFVEADPIDRVEPVEVVTLAQNYATRGRGINGEAEANATLIAAAPDTVKALQRIAANLGSDVPDTYGAYLIAVNAYRKATNTQQGCGK